MDYRDLPRIGNMKKLFSEEEWNKVVRLPQMCMGMTAFADGKADFKERATIISLSSNTKLYKKNELMLEIFSHYRAWPDESGNIIKPLTITDPDLEELGNDHNYLEDTFNLLKQKISEDAYVKFVSMLICIMKSVAEASKESFFSAQRISEDEVEAMDLIASLSGVGLEQAVIIAQQEAWFD